MARFVLPSPLFLAKSMRTVAKKMGFHSTLGIFKCRGKAERPIFGRFTNHCNRRFYYGPVYLLLLGYALGPFALQPTALAQWGVSDRQMLSNIDHETSLIDGKLLTTNQKLESIYQQGSYIQTDTGNIRTDLNRFVEYYYPQTVSTLSGISNLVAKIAKAVSNHVDLTQIQQDLEDSLTELKLINNNMGYLVEGTALENSDGQGFDNLLSGIKYGSRSMSMADSLQFIAQSLGGLGTGFGPHYQDMSTLPLINTILGWTGGYASHNIQTNGIIGLLQSINREIVKLHTMTNPIISSIEKQTGAITNYLGKFEKTFATFALNHTNLMFAVAAPYTDDDWHDFITTMKADGHFESYLRTTPMLTPQALAFGIIPWADDSEIQRVIGYQAIDAIPQPFDTDYGEMRKAFYQYYGNLRSYNNVFGDEAGDIEETREGASNLVAESTMKTTNVAVRLIPELTVTDLMTPWGDLTTFQNDWKNTKGPSKEDYDRLKGYYQESMQESEDSASFQFDITFGEGIEIHTEEVDLIPDDSVIGNVKTKANKLVSFMCATCRAILLLIFVWRMSEAAISVMNGNGLDS